MIDERKVMLVHAHPDDEVTGTGLTMAKSVASGATVTLVTCTLGEEGEIVVADLAHLASHADGGLGEHRIKELSDAMSALGVTDYLRLGGDGKYRDSGMKFDASGLAVPADTLHDECFWRADLLAAATDLVPVIRDRRPQVLITYDQFGGYGHPDHIQAHRVTMYAAQMAGVKSFRRDLGDPWRTPRGLWTAMSESWMREGLRRMRAAGDTEAWGGMDPDGPLPPLISPDADIDIVVHAPELVATKLAAFRAHRSQIAADSPFFAMASSLGEDAWAREWFRIAWGPDVPDGCADIFAGL